MGICVDTEKPLRKNDPITDSYIRVFRALYKAAKEGNEKSQHYLDMCYKSYYIMRKMLGIKLGYDDSEKIINMIVEENY